MLAGKLLNIRCPVDWVDGEVCSGLVGESRAFEVIDDFKGGCTVAWLLPELSHLLDWKVDTGCIVSHVHVILWFAVVL